MDLLYIAIGGIIGSISRYFLSGIVSRYVNEQFPYGTLSANLLGALVIGILWGISTKIHLSSEIKIFLFFGVLGSFTTFSSYSVETIRLFQDGELKLAFLNVLVNNVGSLILVFCGILVSRYILILFK